MERKHAPEILDSVWKQRYRANMEFYKPTLRIWIAREDCRTLIMETHLFAKDEDHRAILYSFKPFKLFGEEAIVSLDVSDGEPIVEVISR
jgi:hypothetical protein